MDFKERIKLRIKQLGLSNAAVGARMGKPAQNTYVRDLLERTTSPRADSLQSLAEALETTVEWLLMGEGAQDNGTPNARLKAARQAAGFARARNATDAFGWNYNTYQKHESGERGITATAAQKYAKAFGATAHWILYGGRDEPTIFSNAPRSENEEPIDWDLHDAIATMLFRSMWLVAVQEAREHPDNQDLTSDLVVQTVAGGMSRSLKQSYEEAKRQGISADNDRELGILTALAQPKVADGRS